MAKHRKDKAASTVTAMTCPVKPGDSCSDRLKRKADNDNYGSSSIICRARAIASNEMGDSAVSCIVQSLAEDVKTAGQRAVDNVKGATKPYTVAAANKTQAAKDAMTPDQGQTGSKSFSGPGSTSGVAPSPNSISLLHGPSTSYGNGLSDPFRPVHTTSGALPGKV